MDLEQKRTVLEDLEDLDIFVESKEYYQRVGWAWKRGYLLYGPPGTGKSPLVAAMANYLKFDVYDLHLSHLKTDLELRKVLLATTNKSILGTEDIKWKHKNWSEGGQLTLSELLNFTDGLWPSCEEERTVVLTTNHKSKLCTLHIHTSYCTYEGFKTLASIFLKIYEDHPLFEEIKTLLEKTKVTPALITCENFDISFNSFPLTTVALSCSNMLEELGFISNCSTDNSLL